MAQNGRTNEAIEMEEGTKEDDQSANNGVSTESKEAISNGAQSDYKYGQIKFHETGRTAEFVKVNSKSTNWKELAKNLVQKWNLKKPDLLISVTGGANNFAVNRRIDGVIREGIVETAVSTNGWLITGGTHAGVMKYVGAAANDYRITVDTDFAVDKGTDLITLGVATWGTLMEQKSLLENAFKTKKAAILDTEKPQKGAILDPNHSHFILIDDGTENFGADVEPRSEIEQALSKLKVWSSDSEAQTYEMTYVPVVCIMIEGGPNSIKQACLVIDKKTPLVVVSGSGRLSNILASYFDKEDTTDRHRSEELKKLVKDDGKREETLAMIEKMAKSKDLLSVYKEKSGEQVTQEILRLLIKANKDKKDMRREDQLRLTQVLNCADIARTELFDPNAVSDWKESELQKALKYALVNDQSEFVKLFLENGVSANFKKDDLEYIYGHPSCKHDKHTTLCQSLDKFAGKQPCREAKGKVNLEDVGKVIRHLTMENYVLHTDYRRLHGNDENRLARLWHWRSKSGAMISPSKQIEADGEITHWRYQVKVVRPFRAIVWRPVADNSFKVIGFNDIKPKEENINKEDCFQVEQKDRIQVRAGDVIGWSVGEECLTYSGSRSDYPVYRVQIDGNQHDNIIKDKTFTIKERLDYEEYCIEATVEPFRNQQHLFLYALLNNSDEMAQYFWEKEDEAMPAALTASKIYRSMEESLDLHSGEKTSLVEKASEYDERAVDVLRHCYKNNEKRTSNILRLKRHRWGMQTCVSLAEAANNRQFIADSGVENMLTEKWWGKIDKNENSCFMLFLCTIFPLLLPCFLLFGKVKLRQSERRIINDNHYRRAWRRFRDFLGLQFFESPKIKYRYIVLSYIAFLVLFSYIMLSGKLLTSKRTPAEVILILWVVSLFTEEFRQVAVNDIRGWWKKTKAWIKNYWNIVDSVSLIFFTTGFILRFFDNPRILNAARIIWALDLFIFYTRVLQIFTVSRQIGPKLIMIAQMFLDLMFFVCILFVFMIGYGVTVQAILYPRVSGRLAEGVLYRPYFQIYGELFLEEVTPNDDCSSNQTAIDAGALPCPENPALGLLLLAGYMVLSNVLLLNLLIAMFSYTFDQVQEENDLYWEFQRYELIKEYLTAPPLVPPLIIIAHFIFFIRWCLHLGNKCVTWRSYSLKKSREHFATASEYEALVTWEKIMSKKCTIQRASKARKARRKKDGLADLESRLESLIENKLKKALKTSAENTDEQKQTEEESSPIE